MCYKKEDGLKLNINDLTQNNTQRYLNPADINLPSGYQIEVFAQGLDVPSCMRFMENGDILIAESGYNSGNAKLLRLRNGSFEVIADGFETPITGINDRNGDIFVSHRGYVTVVKPDGTKENIIAGLPSDGDYSNSNVDFGPDDKLYFGQGTTTNSGVVGIDNNWAYNHPYIYDNPGSYIMLKGQNFESINIFTIKDEIAYTGAFSPFGIPNMPNEVRKGVIKSAGSILRANIDGTDLEQVAWGFRNLSYIRFDRSFRLFVANQDFEDRGSRPIANAQDELYFVTQGLWYGWPDFSGGEPVNSTRFKPEGGKQPEFLLENHPNVPPLPYATFPSYSNIRGFDFNYNNNFGPYGDVYITEFGSDGLSVEGEVTPFAGYGHRVSKIDMGSGGVTTFAINKSGYPSSISQEGGFGRPVDVTFGPDGAMYVLDFGIDSTENPNVFFPNTGVIWRITRN